MFVTLNLTTAHNEEEPLSCSPQSGRLLVVAVSEQLCLLASSARPAAADGGLTEPATASAAGAHDADQQAEGVPGRNLVSAECPAVVPAAARPGAGGPGQTAGRDGPHPGMPRRLGRPHSTSRADDCFFPKLRLPLLGVRDAFLKNLLTTHVAHTCPVQEVPPCDLLTPGV